MILFVATLISSKSAFSQIDCIISTSHQMPVCSGTSVTLEVATGENLIYFWSPGGFTTSSITIEADESLIFDVLVTDTLNDITCQSEPFNFEVHPTFQIDFEQMQLTCTNGDNDNGNTAMMRATANGESGPYNYEWDVRPTQIAPGNPSVAIGLKAHLWYYINITDQYGCIQYDSVFTRAFSNPVVEIITTPDTAYIQNPYVTIEFNNLSADSVSVISNFWELGDGSPRSDLESLTHVYSEIDDYIVVLTVFNEHGCDTVFTKDVKVLPIKLKVPNIITPNGDNINDILFITEGADETEPDESFKSAFSSGAIKPLSAYYQRTSLVIFNRQGRKVYESTDYNNDWGADGLKDGVYFYVLHCEGFKSNEVYKGSITIMGRGN